MTRPGEKIDKDKYLIKTDVARLMGVPHWRLNQIIKSLGGFPPEMFVVDPYTHGEIRVYQRAQIDQWIETWRERESKKKPAGLDPPHLVRAGPKSWLAAKYGKLSENWRDDLRQGFAECFRVLAIDGVLVFKWNETQVKVGEVLALTPVQPLFGHISGRKGLTHWLVFMSPNA